MDTGVLPSERLVWQRATVDRIVEETPTVKSYFLKAPTWRGFMAGQHVDVRLSAPDGYQAQRSYSIGSALRGPIGGHFTWGKRDGGPLLLVGGGSGVVPMMSILRHRAIAAPEVPAVLVYSVRHFADIIFRDELFERAESDPNIHLILTITREPVAHPRVRSGRIDDALVADVLSRFGGVQPKHTYVCGANAFVDVASRLLIDMGVPFPTIKTERYGGDPARAGADAAPVPDA